MRSVLALGLLVTLSASADAPRRIAPNRRRYTYARPNMSSFVPAKVRRPRRALPSPVGPTKRPGVGWITLTPAPAAADSPRAAPADASLCTELVNTRPGIVSRAGGRSVLNIHPLRPNSSRTARCLQTNEPFEGEYAAGTEHSISLCTGQKVMYVLEGTLAERMDASRLPAVRFQRN